MLVLQRGLAVKTRLQEFWDSLRTSYWFVPTLMTVGAVVLAAATVNIDRHLPHDWVSRASWGWGELWAGGAEGAREVLSVVASTVITVAGVVFSITIASLTLASQQFGPHLLRNFLRDRGSQITLGTFLATFVYSLWVLRTVRAGEFVPDLSVLVSLVLALVSVGVLIYFIHHISASIQAESVASAVAAELKRMIDTLYPERPEGAPVETPEPPASPSGQPFALQATTSGYLKSVEMDTLPWLAEAQDVLAEVVVKPGDFVTAGRTLALVWPAGRCQPEFAARMRRCFILGRHRRAIQDIRYPAHQLVEIALRALSPGVNDSFTALMCVDWLGAALSELAQRRIPSPHIRDGGRRLRIIYRHVDFAELAEVAFNHIRQDAETHVAVVLRQMESIADIATHVRRAEDGQALRRHAELLLADARERLRAPWNLEKLERRHQQALEALARAAGGAKIS